MAADADIFMILLRPTRVPVVGEAVSHLFQGQILVESLKWNLHNEDERKIAAEASSKFDTARSALVKNKSIDLRLKHLDEDKDRKDLQNTKKVQAAMARASNVQETKSALSAFFEEQASIKGDHSRDRDKEMGLQRKLTQEQQRAADLQKRQDAQDKKRSDDVDEAERNPNFEFTFTKPVDIATTQLLNSMKAGDVFPSGTLTIHKRSASASEGTSLVFTIQKIRLLDYKLLVTVTDTMTDMMEEWTCEFGALAYVYKNPPSHNSHGNAVQGAAKTASQGTMRAFTMKNIGSPI